MTELGDKLQEALKANNINNYIWKGPKKNAGSGTTKTCIAPRFQQLE
jgi:hypothetical protein